MFLEPKNVLPVGHYYQRRSRPSRPQLSRHVPQRAAWARLDCRAGSGLHWESLAGVVLGSAGLRLPIPAYSPDPTQRQGQRCRLREGGPRPSGKRSSNARTRLRVPSRLAQKVVLSSAGMLAGMEREAQARRRRTGSTRLRGAASGGAHRYARCPDVVVGYRHASGAGDRTSFR